MRVESADRVEQDIESLHLDGLLRKTDTKATSAIRCLAPAGERRADTGRLAQSVPWPFGFFVETQTQTITRTHTRECRLRFKKKQNKKGLHGNARC